MSTNITWSQVRDAVLRVSKKTHSMGRCSCFGHCADDVLNYPDSPAGYIWIQEGLTRVFCRYIGEKYHLASLPMPSRGTQRGYYIAAADGSKIGPFESHRSAAWVRTNREINGQIVQIPEDRSEYISRCVARIDEQLMLESDWQAAQDALSEYLSVPDRYNLRGSRFFDQPHQQDRRSSAIAQISARVSQ